MKLEFQPQSERLTVKAEDALIGHVYRPCEEEPDTRWKYLCLFNRGKKYFLSFAEYGNLYAESDVGGPFIDCGPGKLEITIS